MAAAIEQEFGLACELIGGGGGIFAVDLDGSQVYTNNRMGGVPPEEAVLEALRDHL